MVFPHSSFKKAHNRKTFPPSAIFVWLTRSESKEHTIPMYMYTLIPGYALKTIKRHFPPAHIEIAHGNIRSNIDYICKKGKWENTSKAETRIEGTYEEWGDIPKQKGQMPEMEELYQMIDAGYTNAEILATNNDYILNIDKLDKVRITLLQINIKENGD